MTLTIPNSCLSEVEGSNDQDILTKEPNAKSPNKKKPRKREAL